jgi:aminobenzoyl-glutamate utilization protein B
MAKKNQTLQFAPHLRTIRAVIEQLSSQTIQAAERIADLAEPAMKEVGSSAVLADLLKRGGLEVSRPWKHIPTAFKAVAGSGRPVVGIMAEYDALPNCGQGEGQWGHGCGHNLLGAASALAGIAAAATLKKLGKGARIVVFGTPAEESLYGKVIMADAGAFFGLDAMLGWHPSSRTSANLGGGSAMDSIRLNFTGQTAHAAGEPHRGRSALDAAILTEVAVNFLREHVEENARIHCVITDGGEAPNVVPEHAQIWYYVRGKDRRQVDQLRRRLLLCAKAGALATETRLKVFIETSLTERVPNQALAGMLDGLLRRCGPPVFTAADRKAAQAILPGKVFSDALEPIKADQGRASSDEDNVSWFAPLGKLDVACVPKGSTYHHRDFARLIRTSGAHCGMLKAAEYLAAAAVELVLNRPLLAASQAEFKANRKGKEYNLPMNWPRRRK